MSWILWELEGYREYLNSLNFDKSKSLEGAIMFIWNKSCELYRLRYGEFDETINQLIQTEEEFPEGWLRTAVLFTPDEADGVTEEQIKEKLSNWIWLKDIDSVVKSFLEEK